MVYCQKSNIFCLCCGHFLLNFQSNGLASLACLLDFPEAKGVFCISLTPALPGLFLVVLFGIIFAVLVIRLES